MKTLLPILGFIVLILFAGWLYVCQIKGACGPAEEKVASEESLRLKTLEVSDGGKLLLTGYDHFSFEVNEFKPILNDNNTLFLDKIANHLQQNPTLLLNITGGYGTDEAAAASGFFENIGLSRADAVRKLMIQRGVSPGRVTLSHNIGAAELRKQPIEFDFYTLAQSVEFTPLAYTFEDMTFSDESFAPDGAEFRPILPLVQYADSVRQYLALHKNKKLSIIGHTDSTGDAKNNLKLGLERAQNTMRYFRELGIPPSQMAAYSEGSKHPVSDNSTEVGKRRNRRINFIIE